ncbi:hypothetical protein HYR69_06475, partial [Candidatus Sumerlaeota bacterium]|nr:hypothetical protein [Candidatus Sumerlaeota bacterium]
RYTACPSIRFVDDFYYMFYLEAKPGPEYETYLVRSKDLVHWELSPRNPVLAHTERDKAIANPRLTGDERARIAQALNRNNSDFDLCEFRGKVFITYSWGNQEGNEFLAEARYAGSLKSLLSSFFR